MAEIDEICKKLVISKQVLSPDEHSSNNGDMKTKRKCRISRKNKVEHIGTDKILRLSAVTIPKLQPSPINPITVNDQIEPLDLSTKPTTIPERKVDKTILPTRMWKPKSFEFDKFFSSYIRRYTANDVCNARCPMLYKDHYHCFAENGNCRDVMKGKDKLRQHGKLHCIAEELTHLEFSFCVSCSLTNSKSHYHCSYSNCEFISTDVSNMDRLVHVDSTHCSIISKRVSGPEDLSSNNFGNSKKRRKTRTMEIPKLPIDNQFNDFDPISIINAINKNCLRILDRLSPEKGKQTEETDSEEVDIGILMKINEAEKHFFQNGDCARLFCNLKKSDHYHCAICDRGSSKKDLYIRHLKQRHK